ncbi:MAG TPA: cupin domain-containing protein [Methanobacteriales archaeon]|nr:MAG: Transcriptional regulator, MerR family [Methanobacteriaceae archaeon 41_258]MBC7089804.1 cupin domain-containing protein [Methanobacteriaceae archaeon]MBC7096485.1 cupin domain-containing protein [Methanobacteriales archaeon]HIH62224.1 cupin domain-containing protein [Methanobacteriales archaeon]
MTAKATIGEKIKKFRKDKEISLKELSENSGVKEDLIKDIEDGEIIPSLAPLIKISRSLGIRLGTLLDDTIEEGPVIVREGKAGKVIHFSGQEDETSESHLDFYSLAAGKVDRHMEPFIVQVEPHHDKFKLSSHEGEEFIYVLEGEIEILYGKEKYHLKEGDSIYYDSIVPHHLHTRGDKPARILAVVYTPF